MVMKKYPGMACINDEIESVNADVTRGTRYSLSSNYYWVRTGEKPVIMPRMTYNEKTESDWKKLIIEECGHGE